MVSFCSWAARPEPKASAALVPGRTVRRVDDSHSAGQRRDGGHFVAREREFEDLQVIAQLFDVHGAGDGDDPLLLHEPTQHDLRNARLPPRGDLLLIHWPNPAVSLEWALGEFAALRQQGKVRTIGVSNFPIALLRQALEIVGDLAANQVEYHPYLGQRALLQLMRERGLVLIAHSPLARGALLGDPVMQAIAGERRLSVAQVALRWLVQQERVVAIPGVVNVAQLRENLKVLEVKLTNDEMDAISALARGTRIVNPPHSPAWD